MCIIYNAIFGHEIQECNKIKCLTNMKNTIGIDGIAFDKKGNWRVEVTEPQLLEWRKGRESDRRYITFLRDRNLNQVKHRLLR